MKPDPTRPHGFSGNRLKPMVRSDFGSSDSGSSAPATALMVASQGDKHPDNILPPLRTPWTALQAALDGPPPVQEGMSLSTLGANAASRFDSWSSQRRSCEWGFDLVEQPASKPHNFR